MKNLSLWLVLVTIGMVGCSDTNNGDTNNESSAIATSGNFKDTNVIGLAYSSGSYIGTTEENGSYTCETENNITFSLGNIELGTVLCRQLITPIELFANSDIDTLGVVNIVKFLTIVDDDNDLENGINITQSVQESSYQWDKINFESTDTNLTSIKNKMDALTLSTHTIPTDDQAKNHLSKTLRCAYSGAFIGAFKGTDNGAFGALIDPDNGMMLTLGYSTNGSQYFRGWGDSNFTLDSNREINGKTTNGASYSGKINTVNSISGDWNNTGASGTFSGTRIGNSANSKYRIVGGYIDSHNSTELSNYSSINDSNNTGIFTFDIDTSDNITGIAYNPKDNTSYSISGTIVGTEINATANDGLISINANYDKTSGIITSASWQNTVDSTSGIFQASGCKLN